MKRIKCTVIGRFKSFLTISLALVFPANSCKRRNIAKYLDDLLWTRSYHTKHPKGRVLLHFQSTTRKLHKLNLRIISTKKHTNIGKHCSKVPRCFLKQDFNSTLSLSSQAYKWITPPPPEKEIISHPEK